MIAIIDYGMGNLRSVQKGLERVGFNALVTRDAGQILSARGVVLPGVGAFNACMENLGKFGLIEQIRQIVQQKNSSSASASASSCFFPRARNSEGRRGLISLPEKLWAFAPAKISKCRTWAGTASKRKPTRRFWKESPTATMSILFIPSTSFRTTAPS